eukprot:TRINITY_DN4567_c0_g2_i1.p1 TRINITY_DN4567_c0_g2~~TRINITY_DN4567_c0_g2_i1.p1  ORF type:complete len:1011 (+),score=130.54 TRINITY_DN4567_c0_g2_i1:127-3159(+)
MSVLLSLVTACVGLISVRVNVMTDQPVQPFSVKYGDPCSNASKEGCVGGFPFVNAVFREMEKGVDGHVNLAAFLQVTRLIQNHPARLALNDILWKRAGAEIAQIRSPYFLSWSTYVDDVDYMQGSQLSLLMTNVVNGNPLYFTGTYDYYSIAEPVPGVRIAFLVVFSADFYAPTRAINPQVADLNTFLKTKHNVQLVIVIGPENFTPNEMSLLNSSGVDAVFWTRYGSDEVAGPVKNGTWFVPFSKDIHSISNVVLDLDDTSKRIVSIRNLTNFVPLTLPDEYKQSPEFSNDIAFIQSLIDEAEATDPVVGFSTALMPNGYVKYPNNTKYDSCRHQECELGTLITDAMASAQGSEIALCNGGSIRYGWPQGNVTRSMLEAAFPYQNNLCHLNMTAAEIWRALEHSVSTVTSAGQYDPEASLTGQFLQVKGLKFEFDASREPGSRVLSLKTLNGTEWVDIDVYRPYTVVTMKYMCQGGDGYSLKAAPGSVMDVDGADTLSVLSNRLKDLSPYTPAVNGLISLNFNESLPSLHLAKVATDCGIHARYQSAWEACTPCFYGGYHPVPGEDQCVPEPIPSPPTDYVVVIIPLVGGFMLLVLAGLYFWWTRHKSAMEKLVKYAPRGGEVAIIFTDILKSSELWGQRPEAMAVALEKHHKLARDLIEKHEGYEVKTIGDAFMIAFSKPVNAVEFTCDLQLGLLQTEWPAELLEHKACQIEPGFSGLRVRVGVHIGTPVVKLTPQGGYDYEGGIVNECARVSDSGAGGQVIVTETMYKAVEPYLDDLRHVVDVKYLGEYNFKGISHPVSCLQLLPEELLNRKFEALRNAVMVEPEAESNFPERRPSAKSVFTAMTDIDGGKREWISAMQTLRRHVISYGQGGIPPSFIAALMCFCIDAKLAEEAAILTSLLKAYNERPPSSNPPQAAPDTPRSSHSSTTTHNGMKWGTLVPLLHALPRNCVVHMALKLHGDHGGMPLSATTASEVDFRNSHFPSPDPGIVVRSFSEEDPMMHRHGTG